MPRPARHVSGPLDNSSANLKRSSEEKRAKMFPQSTASQWLARRIKNSRTKNRTASIASLDLLKFTEELSKGPETWRAGRGTEHRPEIV